MGRETGTPPTSRNAGWPGNIPAMMMTAVIQLITQHVYRHKRDPGWRYLCGSWRGVNIGPTNGMETGNLPSFFNYNEIGGDKSISFN